MTLHIQMVGKYTNQQRSREISNFYGIGLNVSGSRSFKAFFPDGFPRSSVTEEPGPSLTLGVPNTTVDFEYGANRENWIIFLQEPCPFQYDPEQHQIVYRDGALCFPISHSLPLQREEVPGLRRIFQEVRNCLASARPQDQIRSEVLTMELLLRFFRPEESTAGTISAAELFRDKIKADVCWKKSLEELASEVGYGRDHLRNLFIREYGIPPGEYRVRQRLARIM